MILLYVTYVFIFILWMAIKKARQYEEARENKQQIWLRTVDDYGNHIGFILAWRD